MNNRTRKADGMRPSDHLLDLRKNYLINKYNLGSLTTPDHKRQLREANAKKNTGGSDTAGQWHRPIRHSSRWKNTPRETTDLFFKSDAPEYHSRVSVTHYVVVFGVTLCILVTPIYGLTQLQSVVFDTRVVKAAVIASFNGLTESIRSWQQGDEMEETLEMTQNQLQAIQSAYNQYSAGLSVLSAVAPYLGSQIRLGHIATEVGLHLTDVISSISRITNSNEQGVIFSDQLYAGSYHFEEINRLLLEARPMLSDFATEQLPENIRGPFAEFSANIDKFIIQTRRFSEALRLARTLLGADSIKRYVLLFQNSRELRATGGFMGSFALVDLMGGQISGIEFPGGGLYDLAGSFKSSIIPPRPISILNEQWNIWDANWWPNFERSAKKILWFYDQSGGPSVDGVIAINSDLMLDLLRLTGPVEIQDYNITIDESNFYDVIQTYVEIEYDKERNQPKEILRSLLPIIMQRLAQENFTATGEIFSSALTSGEIQIFMTDPAVQQSVRDLGWSGMLRQTDRDYLQIVSTNIAGGKSDGSIYSSINHRALIGDNGEVVVTVSYTKEHRASPDDLFAFVNNVDYLRVYTPLGSTLVRASGFEAPPVELFKKAYDASIEDNDIQSLTDYALEPVSQTESYSEDGHTVFANWVQVKPGESATISLTYRLPFTLNVQPMPQTPLTRGLLNRSQRADTYSLLTEKQSGKKNVLLTSHVVLPPALTLLWSGTTDGTSGGFQNGVFSHSAALTHDNMYGLLLAHTEKP